MQHGRDLTTGSIARHVIAFSMPMLAGNLIQTAYSLVNAVWVGKFLGTEAMAAITVGFPAVFVLMAFGGGLTLATNILVAQYVGARDWNRLKQTVNTSTVLIGGISLVFVAFGLSTAHLLLRLMSTPPSVMPLATGYLRIFLLCLPSMFGFFLVGSTLRGAGDSKTPLYFQAFSLAMNAALDPVLMFGLVGLPRLGLNGTAVATLISQTLGLAALCLHLQRQHHLVTPDWRHLRADWPTCRLIVKIGFPSVVQQSIVSISMLFVVGFVNSFGERAAAAYGAATRIDQIAFLPAMTIGMAVSTLAGQNIGAGRYDRVNRVFWAAMLLAGGITLMGSALAVAVPQLLLRMFISDPDVIGLGVRYLHIVGGCYIFFAILFVSNGVINGAGHTLATTLITLVSLWAVRVPMAAFLSRHMQRVEGIWYAIAISFAASMMSSIGYYLSGRWKRGVIKHAPVQEPAEQVLGGGA